MRRCSNTALLENRAGNDIILIWDSLGMTVLVVPTIGIGADVHCDGQVLVVHDLLGLFDRFTPKFAKGYVNLNEQMLMAFESYRDEVLKGEFPSDQHSFHNDGKKLQRMKE